MNVVIWQKKYKHIIYQYAERIYGVFVSSNELAQLSRLFVSLREGHRGVKLATNLSTFALATIA